MTLSLDRVVLRTPLVKGARPWTLELGPGTHALHLASPEAAVELTRSVSGLERPKRGRVLVDGKTTYRTPALRARIGSQFGSDFGGVNHLTVEALWATVRELRKRHGAVLAEPLGLLDSHRLTVPIAQLSLAERRDFELELALGIDNAHVVWLSAPPRTGRPRAQDAVLDRLRRRAAAGAVVVVTTSTEREAAVWGDQRHSLQEGRSEPEGRTILLVVERPREIAADLQQQAVVLATELDAERPRVLLVHGTDDLALRRACGAAVVARHCELFEMVSLPRRASPPRSPKTGAIP